MMKHELSGHSRFLLSRLDDRELSRVKVDGEWFEVEDASPDTFGPIGKVQDDDRLVREGSIVCLILKDRREIDVNSANIQAAEYICGWENPRLLQSTIEHLADSSQEERAAFLDELRQIGFIGLPANAVERIALK